MIQFAPADAARQDAQPLPPSLEDIQARRKLAEAMLRQGSDASPVQHWTQGLARVAAALSGRWQLDQANSQSGKLQRDANSTLLDLYKPSVTGAPMPAVPQAQPTAQAQPQAAQEPLNDDQQGVANFAQGMNTQGLSQALPGKVATALDPSLVGAIKNFEGYAPKASWDYKQNSNGYGTKAQAPGEQIDRATAETRLQAELGKAQGVVESFAPNAPDGVKRALTSLTYNAGDTWTRSGLGAAVRQGDWQTAQQRLLQYNKAGGQTLPGLQTRRAEEAKWMAPQPQQQPTQVADASQGQGMTRETLSRMLANPLTRDAAQKFILDKQKSDTFKFQAAGDTLYRTDEHAGTATPVQTVNKPAPIKEGYRWTADGRRQEVVPGGPADQGQAVSVGDKAIDRNFAKTYEDDIASGGLHDALTNMGVLRSIATKLSGEGHPNVSGPWRGLVPDGVQAFTNPEALDIKNNVASVIQRSLRPVLGSQFTEKEGENLIARAYNPQLSEKDNAARLSRMADTLEKIAKAKLAAATYFETHGTLKGYKGASQFSVNDVLSAVEHGGPSSPLQNTPHPAATHVWNPRTGAVDAVGGP